MINRQTLSDQIRDALLERILSNAYQQGDRLVESQIAKEFGVSQAPVREALRDLSAMRFVEQEAFKGSRVRRISKHEIAQIYPVRAALEELAGRLAAAQFKGNTDLLESIYQRMMQAAESDDVRALTRLDAQFHRTIIEAADNSVLTTTWESLMIESWTFVTAFKVALTDTKLMSVVEMHRPLIEALHAGDAEVVARRLKDHVSDFADVLGENEF